MKILILSMMMMAAVEPQIDPELSSYIASRRKLMDDASRPIADRETVAIELAGALDRSAWLKPDAASRQALWTEARGLLDGFSARNPNHPRARLFAFQGAIYLWAGGDGWRKLAERNPTDQDAAARAVAAFEAAANRLRPLAQTSLQPHEALAQNIRFRLAQSLWEWAKLLPDRPAAQAFKTEAIASLAAHPFTEKGLVGYASALQAELLADAGRFDEAATALDVAAKSEAPPSEPERLAILIDIAAGRHRIDEARQAIDSAKLDEPTSRRLRWKLALAERAMNPSGPERRGAEVRAFAILSEMKAKDDLGTRQALLDAARAIEQPEATSPPEALSLVAEGAAILGQIERAATLDIAASERWEAIGQPEQARASRFRAAAMLFEAGRDVRAVALFDAMLADRGAGDLRARAGMLKALAIGRGLAAGVPGLTRERYLKALGDQIALFPHDATTGEARWLLGRALLESGQREDAKTQWKAIPRSQARWIDARLAMVSLDRLDLADRLLVERPAELQTAYQAAEASRALASEARDDAERADVVLEQITLEMTPSLGDPANAVTHADRLRVQPLRSDQRRRVDHLRILALAAAGRTSEAETLARDISGDESVESLLGLARELDHLAVATQGDRASQRVGEVASLVADRLQGVQASDGTPASEAILRRARARMLMGDEAGARRILDAIPMSPLPFSRDADRLADLAEVLLVVGRPQEAITAYRALSRLQPDGSPRWLAARLDHARALDADRKRPAARNLIEGIKALYPELGGPVMARKYETLARKLAQP